MEIRSYRKVFDLERRIYRIDRLRLNPGGVPVRGVVYSLAMIGVAVVAGRIPVVGDLARTMPWLIRDLALPAGTGALLTVVRIEGRPFHLAANALARLYASSRHGVAIGSRASGSYLPHGERWRFGELLILPDGSDHVLRRMRYSGPGAVLVTVAARRTAARRGVPRALRRRADLTVRSIPDAPAPARGEVIVLERGARMDVR